MTKNISLKKKAFTDKDSCNSGEFKLAVCTLRNSMHIFGKMVQVSMSLLTTYVCLSLHCQSNSFWPTGAAGWPLNW